MAIDEEIFIIGYTLPTHEDEHLQYEAQLQYAARLLLGSNTSVGHIWSPAGPEAVAELKERDLAKYDQLIRRAGSNLERLGIQPPKTEMAGTTPDPGFAGTAPEQTARQLAAV